MSKERDMLSKLHCQAKVLIVVGSGLLALAPVPAAAETYAILANHGSGWVKQGEYRTLDECNREAAGLSAGAPKAQFGCLGAAALREYMLDQAARQRVYDLQKANPARREAEFQQASVQCAALSRVKVNVKPGARVEYFGTAEQRFSFSRCMTQAGHDLE
jgi:hypothetical protein